MARRRKAKRKVLKSELMMVCKSELLMVLKTEQAKVQPMVYR